MNTSNIAKENIKVIILAGCRDFGRCPLASELPLALWPIMTEPVLKHLLRNLVAQGIKRAVVCSNGDSELLHSSVGEFDGMEVTFLNECLPVGTAGCIRDAADRERDSLLVVMRAAMVSPPDIAGLVKTHSEGQSAMTVMFKPGDEASTFGQCANIYVCEPSVPDLIPAAGFCDIKESLIPEMVRAGIAVKAAIISEPLGDFQGREGYIRAVGVHLQQSWRYRQSIAGAKCNRSSDVIVADSAHIASNARIFGPVGVTDGAVISEGSVVFGPAVIGRNVVIGKDAVVESSVLWDGASVGYGGRITHSIIGYGARVGNHKVVSEKAVSAACSRNWLPTAETLVRNTLGQLRAVPDLVNSSARAFSSSPVFRRWVSRKTEFALAMAIVLGVFIWSYLPQLRGLWGVWSRSDEYSAGLLVPFLAVYALFVRRDKLTGVRIKPSMWGLATFLGAQGMRYFGLLFTYGSAERFSVVLSIAAIVLLLFGWKMLGKVWVILAFLFLMLPLPRSVHSAVMLPMQNVATSLAVVGLQTLGYAVAREGNIININDTYVAVAEACNGLRMVTSFFMISYLVALIIKRPWWQKLVVIVSSLPIALFCNAMRLIVTAVAFTAFNAQSWEVVFHDFGGYAMMPLALSAIIIELWFLGKLLIVRNSQESQILVRGYNVNSH